MSNSWHKAVPEITTCAFVRYHPLHSLAQQRLVVDCGRKASCTVRRPLLLQDVKRTIFSSHVSTRFATPPARKCHRGSTPSARAQSRRKQRSAKYRLTMYIGEPQRVAAIMLFWRYRAKPKSAANANHASVWCLHNESNVFFFICPEMEHTRNVTKLGLPRVCH